MHDQNHNIKHASLASNQRLESRESITIGRFLWLMAAWSLSGLKGFRKYQKIHCVWIPFTQTETTSIIDHYMEAKAPPNTSPKSNKTASSHAGRDQHLVQMKGAKLDVETFEPSMSAAMLTLWLIERATAEIGRSAVQNAYASPALFWLAAGCASVVLTVIHAAPSPAAPLKRSYSTYTRDGVLSARTCQCTSRSVPQSHWAIPDTRLNRNSPQSECERYQWTPQRRTSWRP